MFTCACLDILFDCRRMIFAEVGILFSFISVTSRNDTLGGNPDRTAKNFNIPSLNF